MSIEIPPSNKTNRITLRDFLIRLHNLLVGPEELKRHADDEYLRDSAIKTDGIVPPIGDWDEDSNIIDAKYRDVE